MKEMRIREFSSWSIEPGNFLLYRYFFFFFFKFLASRLFIVLSLSFAWFVGLAAKNKFV